MKRIGFLIVYLLILIPTAIGQEDKDNILLDMLSLVPNSVIEDRSKLAFVDLVAMSDARTGDVNPQSTSEYMSDREIAEIYFATMFGSGSDTVPFNPFEILSESFGFEYFDINTITEYGLDGAQVSILTGEFDVELITSILSGRGYSVEIIGNFVLVCGPIGCENGGVSDLDEADRSMPFGGEFGRQQPILVSNNMLISAPDLPDLMLALETIESRSKTLADTNSYITAIQAINLEGSLLQAKFFYPKPFLITQELSERESLSEQLEIYSKEILPEYELMLLVDTATDEYEVTYLILVYENLSDAIEGIHIVAKRLTSMRTTMAGFRPLEALLQERGVTRIEVDIYNDDIMNQSAGIIKLSAPLPTNEPLEPFNKPALSSLVYRFLYFMVENNDFLWVATEIIEE